MSSFTQKGRVAETQKGATIASRIERYEKQRIEWIKCLQRIITPAVDGLIRSMLDAAVIVVNKLPLQYTINKAFYHLVKDTRTWTEAKFDDIMGREKVKDADTCLQMAVRAHATIMALSTANKPNARIMMPSIYKFFRQVFEDVVDELSPPNSSLFKETENFIKSREAVRNWIDKIVENKTLSLVPISVFANLDKRPKPAMQISRVGDDFDYIPPQTAPEEEEEVVVPEKEPVAEVPPPPREPEPEPIQAPISVPCKEDIVPPVLPSGPSGPLVPSGPSESASTVLPPPSEPDDDKGDIVVASSAPPEKKIEDSKKEEKEEEIDSDEEEEDEIL